MGSYAGDQTGSGGKVASALFGRNDCRAPIAAVVVVGGEVGGTLTVRRKGRRMNGV